MFLCHRRNQKEKKLAVKVMKKAMMVQKNMVHQVQLVTKTKRHKYKDKDKKSKRQRQRQKDKKTKRQKYKKN